MIDIPPRIVIDSINDFCIFFFKDLNHNENAPPHFHIVFPVYNETGLIVTIITKQIDKRKDYYLRGPKGEDAVKAFVYVDNNIFNFLNKPSIVDCNRAELLTKTELLKRIDFKQELNIKCREIPQFLKKEICAAIKISPLIPPNIKKIVKEVLKSIS